MSIIFAGMAMVAFSFLGMVAASGMVAYDFAEFVTYLRLEDQCGRKN